MISYHTLFSAKLVHPRSQISCNAPPHEKEQSRTSPCSVLSSKSIPRLKPANTQDKDINSQMSHSLNSLKGVLRGIQGV